MTMTMNITEPLRLAVGSHQAGSGKGCAMNVVSWESGDSTITDLPPCADPMLAKIVQRVNDRHCSHRDGDLLCPACSLEVLALAHRTVGTSDHGLSDVDLRRVYVRVACRLAREVVHLAGDPGALRAIEAAECWAGNPTNYAAGNAADAANAANGANAANAANAAANAANGAYAAAYAAYAAAYAAYAAANAANAAANAADVGAYAADAAAYAAADAADASPPRLRVAHLAVDDFLRLTGLTEHAPDQHATEQAIHNMCATN
jgi:hypothetical protein